MFDNDAENSIGNVPAKGCFIVTVPLVLDNVKLPLTIPNKPCPFDELTAAKKFPACELVTPPVPPEPVKNNIDDESAVKSPLLTALEVVTKYDLDTSFSPSNEVNVMVELCACLLYTSPSPRDS